MITEFITGVLADSSKLHKYLTHLFELALIAGPVLGGWFVISKYTKLNAVIPEVIKASALLYHVAELSTAILLGIALLLDPALIVEIGEFKAVIIVMALLTGYKAYHHLWHNLAKVS